MRKTVTNLTFIICLLVGVNSYSQSKKEPLSLSNSGWFSLGGRSTVSIFDHDGTGLGTGGQFRIQLSNRVNTDWFADYITIHMKEGVRSTYYHIGWSVLFYPFEGLQYSKIVHPYILAGHCFDYNEKTVISNPSISKSRWGSAVQAGIGTNFNVSKRFDISLTIQYMIHLTKELEVKKYEDGNLHIHGHSHPSLEGHHLTTISLNYKLCRLWKK